MELNEINTMKGVVEELLKKMTMTVFKVELQVSSGKNKTDELGANQDAKDFVDIEVTMEEPQVLIGQNGQTLFELQRLLRIILNKKLQKDFYINLDINDYKKKKIQYLKELAIKTADQVAFTGEKKILSPMPAYERRIIHAELSGRQDVITESEGEGINRYIIIAPR